MIVEMSPTYNNIYEESNSNKVCTESSINIHYEQQAYQTYKSLLMQSNHILSFSNQNIMIIMIRRVKRTNKSIN